MALQSNRFAGDRTLQACAAGAARLAAGSSGDAVRKIQQALIDVGFALPQSGVDGRFGAETTSAVKKLQGAQRLSSVDGIVGPATLLALDALLLLALPKAARIAPAGTHWGVDSAAPANFAIHNRSGALTTLFDLVTEELGMPEFWGRYLFKSDGLGVTAVSKAEAQFIRDRSGGKCRILLIANIAEARFSQGRLIGQSDALGAIGRCGALGVPVGAFVFADIEPQFRCSAGWFQGWWERMLLAGRGRGGLYVEPGQLTFSQPHRAALKATLDIFSAALDPDPQIFTPDPPAFARLLWSQRPLRFFKSPIDPNNFIPDAYAPREPTYQKGMTAIWQYAGNCPVIASNRASIIDMNLATDLGLASMWNP